MTAEWISNSLLAKYLEDLASVRRTFLAFATKKGFNHADPKNWYTADLTDVSVEGIVCHAFFVVRLD